MKSINLNSKKSHSVTEFILGKKLLIQKSSNKRVIILKPKLHYYQTGKKVVKK